jgi:hypothetical protein
MEAYDPPRTMWSIASSTLRHMMASLVSILEAVKRYVLSILQVGFDFLLSLSSTTHSYVTSGRIESACSYPMLESGASREMPVK